MTPADHRPLERITINRAGYPVGRTMGAPIDDDWSVELIHRAVRRRFEQMGASPRGGRVSGNSIGDRGE